MTLNCLPCGPAALERTDSDIGRRRRYEEKTRLRLCCGVERSWSGNLAPHAPPYESMRSGSPKNLNKLSHRRHDSAGEEEPKLSRSGGMRRDWSFENLKQRIMTEKKSLLDKTPR